MQKVAKELLDRLRRGQHSFPQTSKITPQSDVSSLDVIRNLLVTREASLGTALGGSLQKGLASGKTIFDVWMTQQSDNVQGFAL